MDLALKALNCEVAFIFERLRFKDIRIISFANKDARKALK